MRKRNKIYSVLTLLLTTALCFSTTACSQTRQPAEPTPAQEETTVQEPSVPEPETEAAKDTVPETETEPSTAALSFSQSRWTKTHTWQKVMQTSTTTATIPTQRMKFCRSAFTLRSMSLMKRRTRTPLLPSILTATAMRLHRCLAASPSGTSTPRRRRRSVISLPHSMTVAAMLSRAPTRSWIQKTVSSVLQAIITC